MTRPKFTNVAKFVTFDSNSTSEKIGCAKNNNSIFTSFEKPMKIKR